MSAFHHAAPPPAHRDRSAARRRARPRVAARVAVSLAASVALLSLGGSGRADTQRPVATLAEAHRGFVVTHCTRCHGQDKQEGGVRLDDLALELSTVATAERWQRVLGVLNAGDMPPPEEPRPPQADTLDLLAALSKTLASARRTLGDAGRETLVRRLNRREYRHTIRDLLGVEVDVDGLPDDTGTGSFDTIGSGLFMSSDQFEHYLSIARRAIADAATDWPGFSATAAERRTDRREVETLARRRIAGLLNGYFLTGYRRAKEWEAAGADPARTKDFGLPDEHEARFRILQYQRHGPYLAQYLVTPHSDSGAWLMYADSNHHDAESISIPPTAPPGRYLLRLRIAAADDAPPLRRFVEMGTQDGGQGDQDAFHVIETFQVTGTLATPQVLEVPVRVTASGPRTWIFREKRHHDVSAERFQNSLARGRNGIGRPLALWIDWVEWDGPLPPPAAASGAAAVFADLPPDATEGERARTILRRFATLAFRDAAPADDFLDRLLTIYENRRRREDFTLAIREPLAVILASPGFLYLADPPALADPPGGVTPASAPAADGASAPRRLSGRELATRLSYFLWAAPPDRRLLDLAAAGTLGKADVLAAEVDRLIADPRSHDFAAGFAHQWLSLDRLDFFRFDHELYPDFDESTRRAAKREVYETFHDLVARNRDARLLLSADTVVVNGLLAAYYGLDDGGRPVIGDDFRPVRLPPGSPRGGLLGMAAILAMGSNGERTSPVERGAWVLRKLMNDPPPPAPPNVPQLSRLEGKPLSTSERLRLHQEEPQCAQCHRAIDPIGLGLENFDAAGRWRTEELFYKRGWVVKDQLAGKVVDGSRPIDPAGAFHGGPSFGDVFELRDSIAATHGDAFLRGLVENLFAYAIGRPVSFLDADTIDGLTAAARQDAGLETIIQRLVATQEFQTK